MDADELRQRLKQFALRIIHFVRRLPRTMDAPVLARQLLRSGTSAAANYHAACRGRSRQEFFAKLSIAVEEVDETCFWLDLVNDSHLADPRETGALLKEATELRAILAASRRTTRENLNVR